MADTFILKKILVRKDKILKKHGVNKGGKVQQFIDSEVLRRCQPYIPMDSGTLIESGKDHTRIGSGEVKYRTPYARRWYYREAQFQGAPKRGTYWFERMKNEGGKNAILKGARKIAGTK